STATNGTLGDLAQDINDALAALGLGSDLRATTTGDKLRLAIVRGGTTAFTVSGATALGFNAVQLADDNSGAKELGLTAGDSVTGKFKVNTLQDLVQTLNGLIQQMTDGLPFE